MCLDRYTPTPPPIPHPSLYSQSLEHWIVSMVTLGMLRAMRLIVAQRPGNTVGNVDCCLGDKVFKRSATAPRSWAD